MRHRWICGWTLVASLALPGMALAHARLEKAEPAKRAELKTAPAQIRLTFNESVEAAYSKIIVEDAAGKALASGATPGPYARSIELAVPPLPPGAYRVRYRALSVDGHVIEADYAFRIKATAP